MCPENEATQRPSRIAFASPHSDGQPRTGFGCEKRAKFTKCRSSLVQAAAVWQPPPSFFPAAQPSVNDRTRPRWEKTRWEKAKNLTIFTKTASLNARKFKYFSILRTNKFAHLIII
ncbi:hypothetical protein GGTG_11472 [Gaeumannomyces tritici R3-111a-1]|uniref:Uncharacterized protein n=1 Tax=Gaeumannomyces tritici (strain R3-111a-1) TaxID=644352 RepID=J3PDA4_GAET3|nr:hypothetical protein GGTG_11472 [Gaeumannomyces tritici R3-111a-1]EJT70449.1 hypothetical protein GGTG_11472 [Gaeumannomyces tritici R3-111a-1]